MFFTQIFMSDQLPGMALMFAAASIVSMGVVNLASAATAEDLDKDSRQALQTLYKTEPVAETLSGTARAVLMFRISSRWGLIPRIHEEYSDPVTSRTITEDEIIRFNVRIGFSWR
jgi:hypothetical protein